MENVRLYEFIIKGGIFMYPIIACSVFSLAIFLERLWATRKKVTLPPKLVKDIEEMLLRGEISEARAVLQRDKSLFSRIVFLLIEKSRNDPERLRESIETAGKIESSSLSRGIETLGTIANVSTLLGLLGTISGMIKIFSAIYQKQFVNPADLAGGISEALYTTAAGLSVAIPTIVGYRFLNARIDRIILSLEEISERFLSFMKENKMKE